MKEIEKEKRESILNPETSRSKVVQKKKKHLKDKEEEEDEEEEGSLNMYI